MHFPVLQAIVAQADCSLYNVMGHPLAVTMVAYHVIRLIFFPPFGAYYNMSRGCSRLSLITTYIYIHPAPCETFMIWTLLGVSALPSTGSNLLCSGEVPVPYMADSAGGELGALCAILGVHRTVQRTRVQECHCKYEIAIVDNI